MILGKEVGKGLVGMQRSAGRELACPTLLGQESSDSQ